MNAMHFIVRYQLNTKQKKSSTIFSSNVKINNVQIKLKTVNDFLQSNNFYNQ